MTSLRTRLAFTVVVVIGIGLGAFSLVLYGVFSRTLWHAFDEGLADDALELGELVSENDQGSLQVTAEALDAAAGTTPPYFEIWADDGHVVVRSRSLGSADLGHEDDAKGARAADLVLPNGQAGRLVREWVAVPRRKDSLATSRRNARVVVARDADDFSATLGTLRTLLIGLGLAVLAVAALAGVLVVRGGLLPLARLAERLDALDVPRLGERLATDHLPRELRPVAIKLNELLRRLEEQVARERRLSADVSHELRTPLAGLRSILEVTARRERTSAEYQATIAEALGIILKTSRAVESLLLLARLDAHQLEVTREPVELRGLVDECFAACAAAAHERHLSFANRVEAAASVSTDRDKLAIIVGNLLRNATQYTSEGGCLAVESDLAEGVVLAVIDSGPCIPQALLERIFERFFRGEKSRTATGEHSGIGLALARALGEALGFSLIASNRADGAVVFSVRRLAEPH
jgi:signal transduction histidine kinase